MSINNFLVYSTLPFLISACFAESAHPTLEPATVTQTMHVTPTNTFTPLQTATQTPTDTPTPVPATVTQTMPVTPTDTATPLQTATQTPTDTLTPVPTDSVLRGEVTADRLACRYGPGWPYLYFFGLVKGNRMEIIGRLDDANWIYVQAIGGDKPCWVKTEFMDVGGDLLSVEPIYPEKMKLPVSPYYPASTVTNVIRYKHIVTVRWLDIPLRAGDEENEHMNHYIIEVWRCESGSIIFEPLATNYLEISFVDEPGCYENSRGRVFVQEKHGFAGPAEIPWPPYETP